MPADGPRKVLPLFATRRFIAGDSHPQCCADTAAAPAKVNFMNSGAVPTGADEVGCDPTYWNYVNLRQTATSIR